MPLITLSVNNTDIPVINGIVDQPLTGVWSADLVLDQIGTDALSTGDSVKLTSDDGSWELDGTVVPDRNASFLDAVHVRILGGAGAMSTPASAKAYQKATINDVVKKLMSDSGESLDTSTSDTGFLSTQLPDWSVFADNTTANAITNLINKFSPDCNWRIQNDGKLFIGKETYPQINSNYQFDMLEANPVEGTFILGVTSPFIIPGTSIPDIGNVSRVRHEILPNKIRSHVWITLNEANRTIQNAISNLVSAALPDIDYLALYTADIKSQSSDFLTLDIQPDDKRLPGMSNIPLRTGLAGATMQVASSGKVLLGWSAGDPSKPYVTTFSGETAQKIILKTSTELDLGDANPVDFVILGTTYINDEKTFLNGMTTFVTAMSTFINAVTPITGAPAAAILAGKAACEAFNAMIPTFANGQHLSTIVKVK